LPGRRDVVKTIAQAAPRRSAWRTIKREYVLYFLLVPAIGFTLVFNYLPMGMNVIAFMDYKITGGWMGLGSKWVGFANFKRFLTDPDFYTVALRTITYSTSKLLISFPAPIILALLLNEVRNQAFKRTVQTISYLPFFVSWVTVAGLFYMFLSISSTGLVNRIIEALGGTKILFMSKTRYFLPVILFSTVWKGVGLGSIIYLATIASIEQQLYEASRIDGAGRWRQLLYITLPGIMPAVIIILIMNAGSIFSADFDQIVNFQNDVIQGDTDVINVYAFHIGIMNKRYGIGTAISLFQSVINFTLVWLTNLIAKRVRGTGLF
jgi:putative aldouronate transport system permease protein